MDTKIKQSCEFLYGFESNCVLFLWHTDETDKTDDNGSFYFIH